MKKLALTLLLIGTFLAFWNPVSAGDGKKNGIRIGIINAQMKDDGQNLFRRRVNGIYVAYFREKAIAKVIKTRVGLEYYQNGSKESRDTKLKLGYLSVPMSVGLRIGPIGGYGGVAPGIRLHGTEYVAGLTNKADPDTYDRFDATAFVGAQVKILFVGFDFQYHWGLNQVTNSYQHRFWQLGGNLYF